MVHSGSVGVLLRLDGPRVEPGFLGHHCCVIPCVLPMVRQLTLVAQAGLAAGPRYVRHGHVLEQNGLER